MNNDFYNIEVINQDSTIETLEKYQGKVLLICNTATGCGFTPQYEALEKVYKELKDKGFEILDFPCNQFFEQAKGTDSEINQFCSLKYNTTFKRYKKVDVNGPNAAPIFKYLEEKAPYNKKSGLKMKMLSKLSHAKNNDIRWNFTKFLVDKEGNVIERFEPVVDIQVIYKKILEIL